MATLGSLLDAQASRQRHRVYIIWQDNPITYGEFGDLTDRYARSLYDMGIRRGDRVAIWLQNSIEFAVAYWGNAKLGAISVPLNVLFKPDEAYFILSDAKAKAIVAHAQYEPAITGLWQRLPDLNHAIVVGATEGTAHTRYEDLIEAGTRSLAQRGSRGLRFKYLVDSHKPAVILYTSGTTGFPKGAMLNHDNILFDARACTKVLPVGPADAMLCVLPLYHAYPQMIFLCFAVMTACRVVILERFVPSLVLEKVAQYGCTLFLAVPSMLSLLLQVPKDQRPPISSLRFCISGAAPLPLEVLEQFEREYGVAVAEGDGPTECGPVTCVNPLDGRPRKPGSVGLALPGVQIKIFDDHDRELGPNEIGEIVVRGKNVMLGYYNRPDETAEAMRAGWFHTGDIGKIDEDGYIYILDRKKDMIIVGGINLYPREVEELLYRHPKVAEAAVIGVPDPLRGEAPKALIVLRPGQQATGSEILNYLRPHLANFKLPRSVEFCESLPKSMTGKILKRELREKHSAR
jgi:long-chain acyl-CoA synthetase